MTSIDPQSPVPLSVRLVHKYYRSQGHTVHALRGVDFEVPKGQFVAIMGASGSGKSTLLHLMAGLTQADDGEVRVAGTDLGVMNDKQLTKFRRQHIGLVFQSFNLMPTLTAVENMALPMMLDGRYDKDAQHRVRELLERLGIANRHDHRPDGMSGGEQQRVAIGRALVNQPDILLADEPTGNLDSENSQRVCALLQSLSRDEGKTIVMVTHEASVATYADKVMIMRDGNLASGFETSDYPDAASLGQHYQEVIAAMNEAHT